MGVVRMCRKPELEVEQRKQLQERLRKLRAEMSQIKEQLGDPRIVKRVCKGCGGLFSARKMRTHVCRVPLSQR